MHSHSIPKNRNNQQVSSNQQAGTRTQSPEQVCREWIPQLNKAEIFKNNIDEATVEYGCVGLSNNFPIIGKLAFDNINQEKNDIALELLQKFNCALKKSIEGRLFSGCLYSNTNKVIMTLGSVISELAEKKVPSQLTQVAQLQSPKTIMTSESVTSQRREKVVPSTSTMQRASLQLNMKKREVLNLPVIKTSGIILNTKINSENTEYKDTDSKKQAEKTDEVHSYKPPTSRGKYGEISFRFEEENEENRNQSPKQCRAQAQHLSPKISRNKIPLD